MKIVDSDYLIIGSGLAGLVSALKLADTGKVLIVTKLKMKESNTANAQGGIACVITPEDSFDKHIADTLDAGDGLCDESVVEKIVTSGPERIKELEDYGIRFEQREYPFTGEYDLGKEGGHSKRRVLHSGDITGQEMEDELIFNVLHNKNIQVIENAMAIDLITTGWLGKSGINRCIGAYILDRVNGTIFAARASNVIMASGGCGKVYLYTSNPDVATGDGIAIAWRAGVPIRNMEFIQFHPTCLYHPKAKSFLISEAVRGEGGYLVDFNGRRFMEDYDDRKELAPRDIVARAIDREMKATGAKSVFLDITHKPSGFVLKRFPNIYANCLKFGIDMEKDLIPVVPAAHYCCGGIKADIDGTTELPGFYACGEVASTGLHGANRLASNSLLEAVVCAHFMTEKLKSETMADDYNKFNIPDWEYGDAVTSDEEVVVEHNWNELRTSMWDYVGIVRTNNRLQRALRRITNLEHEIREYYLDYLVTADTLELRNIVAVANIIVRSAMKRKESRGLHYTLDYPDKYKHLEDTIICDKNF